MDQIQSFITAHLPGIWGPLVGLGFVMAYQFLKVKFPSTLSGLPHLVSLPASTPSAPATAPASPASPSPAVPSTPAVSSSHPVINALLGILDTSRVISILTDEVKSMVAPPEPASPVSTISPATG